MLSPLDRSSLVSSYIDQVLDQMSTKDLLRIVADQLEESLSSYSDAELLTEVGDYYPELLEELPSYPMVEALPSSPSA
jgi:hypothetical protein